MKKVYIAGCGGMLGRAFYHEWSKHVEVIASDKDLTSDWLLQLDFRDKELYESKVRLARPDMLIHMGALTDLEYCEQNPDEAYETNTIAVETAVRIANTLNIPIMYISTAGIFDGKKPLYDDWDVPNPLGVYGRSKYAGERFVVENADRYFIFRAGWMMGGGHKDKKFVKKIYDQIKGGAKELFVVNDKDGTPTYTHDFAKNAYEVVNRGYYGLYNMVCAGETSRWDVAWTILNHLGLRGKIKLTAVDSTHFKETYWAVRPPSERLINKRLQLYNMDFMPRWESALERYLDSGDLDEE